MEGALLLFSMVVGAFFEAVSIGLVIPFVAVLKQPEMLLKSRHLAPLVSDLSIREPRQLFFVLGPALVALFAIKTGYLVLFYRWLFRFAMKKHVNLARQMLAGYLSAPYTLHLQRNSADLIRATIRSVEDFANVFLVNLLILLGELLVLGAVTLLLLVVQPLATLGAVSVLAVPMALVYWLTQRRLATAGRVAEESFAGMIQWAEQGISGIKETTITGRRSFFIDRHSYHVRRFTDGARSLSFLSSIPRFVIDTLAVGAMVAVAAILLEEGEDLQSILLLLGMFTLAAVRLVPSTSRITSAMAQVRYRYASTEVIYRELRALQQLPTQSLAGMADERVSPVPFRRSLVLEHLSYRYPSAVKPSLDDVSLAIPKGHWVALIGPSGAGKTTLVDLILGFLVPSSGRIVVDGRDLHDNLAGWQRNIGYVAQTVYLTDDSIRRNIAFGVPEEEIDDERVLHALEAAQIDYLARSLPEGLDAMIGQRGGRLSGGERQRLGIARALYHDPDILVIDEATANLDPATETAVVEAIGALKGKKTIIAITHRAAFVRNCDCIYMFVQGRLRNCGGYSDLLSRDPAFAEFCGDVPKAAATDFTASV